MIQALVTYLESTEDVAKFVQNGYGLAFSFGNAVITKKDPLAKAEVSTGWTFEQIVTKSLIGNLNIGQIIYMLPKGSKEVVRGMVAFLGCKGFVTGDDDHWGEAEFVRYSDFGVTWFVDESSAKQALEESEDE